MIGQRLAHYEIVERLGEGGMGAVYRARDPKLGRDVAIKVLNARHVDSDDARARFEREARAVAALSHPNILAIHDFGEHEGTVYAVTELLEGESLHDRLRKGPLPLRAALDLGAQIADGLGAAHEKGIVHRDLKPANVFVSPDGRAKILDFGLAKAQGPLGGDATIGATVAAETSPGTVLGTVRYMSPEQVRGEEVDARSDIFSFGTLLWEMLTGRTAFDRSSAAESMSAILNEDLEQLTTDDERAPPLLDRIIHRCVDKQPDRRFRTAHDLAFALRSVGDASTRSVPAMDVAAPVATSTKRRGPWLALLFVAGLVVGGLGVRVLVATEPSAPVKIYPVTYSGFDAEPTASPDGNTIAFTSERDGRSRIWLRQMRGGIEVPLTDGLDTRPDFSPDGSTILFMRREEDVYSAYRVPVVGGAARKVLHNVYEARWGPDGRRIAFARTSGSAAEPVTTVGLYDLDTATERNLSRYTNRFVYGMSWSPDGTAVSTIVTAAVLNRAGDAIHRIDVETGTSQEVYVSDKRMSSPTWTSDGRGLYFAESTSLLGDISSRLGLVHRFDLDAGALEPLFWVQSVYGGGSDYVSFARLGEGRLLFDEILWRGSLTQVPLQGEAPFDGGRRLTRSNARDRQPAFSPDGERVVFSSNRSGNLDIWSIDLATGETRQLTDDEADDWDPAFNHDGTEILWSSARSGPLEIWAARADGSGARQLSEDGVDAENPTQSPDGEWITYASGNPEHPGIFKMRSDGSEPTRLVAGSYLLPEMSPDGQYVAYVGNNADSRTATIFVSRTSDGEPVFTASTRLTGLQDVIAAGRVRWMPDGESLVFVSSGGNRYGLFEQDFVPGEDTRDTRRTLVAPSFGTDVESFGIAPDGRSVVIGRFDHYRTVKIAEDLR